jgi:hypothetical protein
VAARRIALVRICLKLIVNFKSGGIDEIVLILSAWNRSYDEYLLIREEA